MHTTIFKYYKATFLVPILVTLAIALYLSLAYAKLSVSVITIITLLIVATDKWLWKYRPFSYLFWTKDFSGTYEGVLEYEFRDDTCNVVSSQLRHVKVITQSGSRIEICSFTFDEDGNPSSPSTSMEVTVTKTDLDVYSLIYTYQNQGNPKLGFSPHFGTEVIKVIEGGKKKVLSGSYYTNRLPYQTRGKFIDLVYKSASSTHPF